MNMYTQIRDGEFTATIYGHIRDKKFQEAIVHLNHQLNTYQNSRATLSLLGYCYYQCQDYVNASDCYELLCQLIPENMDYKLYYAQSLYNASMFQEAMKISSQIDDPKYSLQVVKLQAAIKFGQEDYQGAKALVERSPKDDADTYVNNGCLLYNEELYQEAEKQFAHALKVAGKRPQIMYAIALCNYRMKNFNVASKYLTEIIEKGINDHQELAIGMATEGLETRSVGNTHTLFESALIETFNLKAAVHYELKNIDAAKESLTDMPPRSESELDPVSLHNIALINMDEKPSDGFEKLQWLLQQSPCPDETFCNLLMLYVKYEYYDLAADVLAENAHLTCTPKVMSQFAYEFLDAVLTKQTSPDDAFAKLDSLVGKIVERIAQLTKQCQECRAAKDEVGQTNAIRGYDDAVDQFLPAFMQQAKILWEAKKYDKMEKFFQKSVDICTDKDVWKINVGHLLFIQDNKYKEAIGFYEPLVKKNANKLLSLSAVVMSNLCVSYILTSRNDEAEEIMQRLDREEEEMAIKYPEKKVYHRCIINIVIGTLYCSKGQHDFGLSRVMKSLEPYNRRLGMDTWFYAKRCLLATLDLMIKQLAILTDGTLDDVITFLTACELYGKTIQANQDVLGHNELTPGANTVAFEARHIKSLYLEFMHR